MVTQVENTPGRTQIRLCQTPDATGSTCTQFLKESNLEVLTQPPSQIRKDTIDSSNEGAFSPNNSNQRCSPCIPIPTSSSGAYLLEGMHVSAAHTPVPEISPRVGPRMCVTCSALPQHFASASVQLRKGPGESHLPGLEFLQWLDSPLKIVWCGEEAQLTGTCSPPPPATRGGTGM